MNCPHRMGRIRRHSKLPILPRTLSQFTMPPSAPQAITFIDLETKQAVSSTIGKIHIRSRDLYNQISRKIWPFQTTIGARTDRFLGSGPSSSAAGSRRSVCRSPGHPERGESLGEIGQGPVEVALGFAGVAAVVVGGGVLGVEPDGLVVVGDRPVEVALGLTGEAAVVVGGGVLGVEPDGLVVVGDRPVEVALGLAGDAARLW